MPVNRATTVRRVASAVIALSAVAAALSAGVGAAEPAALNAGGVPPAHWPSSSLAAPQIEGSTNALRIFGADRYETSLATALTMRGTGDFPFDTPDATSGGASGLASASDWWGIGACPRSVVIVAADSSSDALAAAALSDPTGRSTEPYLRRVAAADPLFDPPGGFSRVDTFAAPILLAPSARSGDGSLALPTRLAAQDLRLGGCTTARQAIIVGGPAAVPTEVEAELVSVGYTEVFRVGGQTRYGTAAAVATALGTAAIPAHATGCADPVANDGSAQMGFWANSVVEYRPNAAECRLLGRSVVLTDGVDGIDAMAAGWWTSYWQVPVLLHNGTERLPRETARALSLLDVDHIVVLGGPARVSQQVVDEAARLASAEVVRVGGSSRYSTSVAMAKHFGGWWPDHLRGPLESSVLCLSASSGSGRNARGWPDALGAGAWCGAASAAAAFGAPERMIGPVTLRTPAMAGGALATGGDSSGSGTTRRSHDAVPVLLVPAGGELLPPSVEQFLTDAFEMPRACTALVGEGASGSPADALAYARALDRGSCPMPGFAVAFGGPATIEPELLGEISSMLSGGLTRAQQPKVELIGAEAPDATAPFGVSSRRGVPLGVGAFATELSMAPVFYGATGLQACMPRRSYADARWLVAETSSQMAPASVVEVPSTAWYSRDADGTRRSPESGAPACMSASVHSSEPLLVRAVDSNGRTSRSLLLAADPSRKFQLTGDVLARLPESEGLSSTVWDQMGTTSWLFETNEANEAAPAPGALLEGERAQIMSTRLLLELRHRQTTTQPTRPSTFTATWRIRTSSGAVVGSAEGEAVFTAGRWHLRGATLLTGGSWVSSLAGLPGMSVDEDAPVVVASPPQALRAGTSDAYGAGGFTATVTVNGHDNLDDIIRWQPEAFINTR